jgi:hypothetical protein
MANCNKHGGKRKGAGRKPKWDLLFKLRVGQDCESLFRQEEEVAKKKAIDEHFRTDSDLSELWRSVNMVPISHRSHWLESEASEQHRSDIEDELEALRAMTANISPASRLLKIPTKPPRGSRLRIISEIAEKYSLSAKQVDNLWQEYRRFERSL